MLVKRFDRPSRRALWAGQKRDVPLEHQVALVVLRAELFPLQLLCGHGQNPEAIVAEALVLFLQPDYQVGVHRRKLAVQLKLRALVEDLFRSPFGEEDRLAFGILHQDGHHAAREVERDLVQLLVLLHHGLLVEVGTIQNRPVEQVPEAGLKVADEVAIEKHFLALLSIDVAMPHEDDPIFGERSGLVRAQHVHAPEVLDGIQPLDDHLLAAHRNRALRKAHRHDHGQHLGSEPHRDCQCKEKGAFPIVFGEPVDKEDQWHHHSHELDHEPGEAAEALVEAGRWRLGGDRASHAAEIGAAPVTTTTAVAVPL